MGRRRLTLSSLQHTVKLCGMLLAVGLVVTLPVQANDAEPPAEPAAEAPAEPAAEGDGRPGADDTQRLHHAAELVDTGPELDAAATGSTAAPDYVSPTKVQLPFGFTWGQNQEDVRVLLKGIGVRITERHKVGPDREAWKLEGFIKPLLVGTTIYFTRGFMEEVEMQFGNDAWEAPDYTRLRRKLLEQFNQVYGPNRVLSDERSVKDNIMQTLLGYQWQTQDTILRVFDFGASNGEDRYRTVSVHYKYRDKVQMARRSSK